MHFQLFNLIAHWMVSALALAVTAAIVPGFQIRGFTSALVAVMVIGAANYIIWPVLFLLTLPLTLITFGFFVFVIDAIVLRLCAAVLKGFEIRGWLSAIFGSLILTLTSSLLHWLLV